MKSLGKKAQEFRIAKGWNTTQMAKAVGTSRQNIENLESKEVGQPRYLKKLAAVMGSSADELLGQVFATTPAEANAMGGTASIRLSATGSVQGVDTSVETIAQALIKMSEAQRELMAGKLASLARAPDSPTLKKSISESLGSLPPTKAEGTSTTPPRDTGEFFQ